MSNQDQQPTPEYLLQSVSRMLAHLIAQQNIEAGKVEQDETSEIVDLSNYGVNVETINLYLNHYNLSTLILNELKEKQPELISK